MMMSSRRSSKKTKTKEDSESLPPDLVIEILRRLPVKLVSRFLLVSKLWSTIIRSQDFIRSFPFPPSIPQPQRLLFALNSLDNQNWIFYLEEEKPALSCLSRTKCQILNRRLLDVHYVNGLINLGYGQQQVITNPSTGKYINLPLVEVKSSKKIILKSFFGHDPIGFQYKVLCMSVSENVKDSSVPSCEHQVFTLGGNHGGSLSVTLHIVPKLTVYASMGFCIMVLTRAATCCNGAY
ncbi:unnamed protein product [Microthlaspi erraticum]|uniref:F-box domain-containing protein n=1 Tax=Microthlaspi erraticum TaxID=1685480 RepID=A0A6D2L332_9BRAS|nr:unnamed protein product [Microthlaspi erraticum]